MEAIGIPDLFFGAVELPMASMDDAVMVRTGFRKFSGGWKFSWVGGFGPELVESAGWEAGVPYFVESLFTLQSLFNRSHADLDGIAPDSINFTS